MRFVEHSKKLTAVYYQSVNPKIQIKTEIKCRGQTISLLINQQKMNGQLF